MIEISTITEVLNHLDGLSAVVFDLDDTLYSEKDYVRSGYKAVSGVIPQVKDAEKKLWSVFERGEPAIDKVLIDNGIFSDGLKRKCLEAYRNHEPNIKLYDGVPYMLRKIRERGLCVGIITDGRSEGQRAKIKALGLDGMVDDVIITDELGGIGYRKPCSKAFELMQSRFNVPYNKMCYVGDNAAKDFIAPEKLGMKSIRFKNKDGLYYEI